MSFPTVQLTDNDVLFFLHIPKTAGTSLAAMLREQFPSDASHAPLHANEFLELLAETIEHYKFIEGHFYYNITSLVPNRNPVYITILRDPVELTISYYSQIRRWVPHYGYEVVKSQSLKEFVSDPSTRYLWANLQTRHVGTDLNIPELASKLSHNPALKMELEWQMDQESYRMASDPGLLVRAQERLSKFACVGLMERFDDSVEVIYRTFGWAVPEKSKVLNLSTNRPEQKDITPEVMDIIQEHTQLDAALYATGKQLFEERYQEMVSEYVSSEKPAPSVELDSESIVGLKRQLEYQQTLIDQLKAEVADKTLIVERLNAIENSFGWRFVLRFNKLRHSLIPEGSPLERTYLKFRGR